MVVADVSSLDTLRRKLAAASGEKVSFLPFVASACCRVLQDPRFRVLNSTTDDKAHDPRYEAAIIQHRAVHLGIATDTDSGLMVPVIRDTDRLGVLEISRGIAMIAGLAARTRSIPAGESSSGLDLHHQQRRQPRRPLCNADPQLPRMRHPRRRPRARGHGREQGLVQGGHVVAAEPGVRSPRCGWGNGGAGACGDDPAVAGAGGAVRAGKGVARRLPMAGVRALELAPRSQI